MIEFEVPEEERLLQEAAERFGHDMLRPREREHEKGRGYAPELHEAYAEQGFDALGLPEEFGGAGLPAGHRIAIWSRIAAADPAAPFALSPLGAGAQVLAASDEGRRLLERRAPGAVVWANGVEVSDGKASGRVAWIPRTEPVEWLVLLNDAGAWLARSGLEVRSLPGRPCGLQAAGGVEVVLADAPVEPLDAVVEALASSRVFAGAVLLGSARDAYDAAAIYCQERIAFGKPIAHHQGLAFQLADCVTELDAAELMLEAAANREDPGSIANAHAYVCRVALRVAERCVQFLGGHGYLYDHRIEKRMRAIRSVASLYGGRILSERDAAIGVLSLPDPLALAQ